MARIRNKYDKQHLSNMNKYIKQVEQIYNNAAKEAAKLGVILSDFDQNKPLSFDDYPQTQAQLNKLLKTLENNLKTAIINGVRSEWTLANNKSNVLCDTVFGKYKNKLTKAQERKYYSNNDKALEQFLKRKTNGLNLSDRVWNYTNQFKTEIEMGLDLGIRSGVSAIDMARELKQYLKEPDKLFRRVRDTHGQLHLSQAAKDYHPGQGVYRSSFKNARRLAATETNIAYRSSDYERVQQLDFIVGIEVHLSNNHTVNGKPLTDICDELQGKYPKDFKFTGWHPQCRCFTTNILKDEDEFINDLLNETNTESENEVTDVPDNFKKWVAENKGRIKDAEMRGTLPYFIADNLKSMDFAVDYDALVMRADFKTVKAFKNKGVYKEHVSIDKTKSDYKMIKNVGIEFARLGKTVEATPVLHFKSSEYQTIYKKLIGTRYYRKCPDLLIDGNFYEVENFKPPFRKKKLSNMISRGIKQSPRIIINNNKGASHRIIKKSVYDHINTNNHILEVWVYEKGKIVLLYKKQ